MARKTFVADTHALLWFLTDDRRISKRAQSILTKAESGTFEILIPTIVMAELLYICERGKSPIKFDEILLRFENCVGFTTVPFDFNILEIMMDLSSGLELHDRIIIATAKNYGSAIISRDSAFKKVPITVIW